MRLVPMPAGGLYRAGRWEDVEQYPRPAQRIDPAHSLFDGPRWEDAGGAFRTAKCSASAEAAIGRAIARYRPRLVDRSPPEPPRGIIAFLLSQLDHEPDFADEPDLVDGKIPPDVQDDLYELHIPATPEVVFIDVDAHETIETLEEYLRSLPTQNGLDECLTDLAGARDRRWTRVSMTLLHALCSGGLYGQVAGIRYGGRPDSDWEAYVLWSPPDHVPLVGDDRVLRWVAPWDDDLRSAAKRLGIEPPEQPG